MEYTNELRQKIFAAYCGCEMIENGRICQFKAGSFDLNEIKNDYYKLALTPLSKITDEDAIEVAKIVHSTAFTNHPSSWVVKRDKWNISIESPKNYFSFNIDLTDGQVDLYENKEAVTTQHPMNHYRIGDYLRSRGYDTGFAEIPSLIEAGIAIENNKTK